MLVYGLLVNQTPRKIYDRCYRCIRNIPEEDEVCVNINGAIQGREHVGDEESLCGAHPEHVLHVLSLLILNHTIINKKALTIKQCVSYRRIPDVMHHELDFLPELLGPVRRAVDQATEQLLVVSNYMEIKLPPEIILIYYHLSIWPLVLFMDFNVGTEQIEPL